MRTRSHPSDESDSGHLLLLAPLRTAFAALFSRQAALLDPGEPELRRRTDCANDREVRLQCGARVELARRGCRIAGVEAHHRGRIYCHLHRRWTARTAV